MATNELWPRLAIMAHATHIKGGGLAQRIYLTEKLKQSELKYKVYFNIHLVGVNQNEHPGFYNSFNYRNSQRS
jgi:hypothetical protein